VRRFLQISLALFAASMFWLALSRAPDANASSNYESPYTYEQTFGTMLRLVRVDLGLKIVEKDKDLGYILFEYTSPEAGNRVTNGSAELIATKNGVQVSVQLPQMPRYHEQMIVDQLAKKLEAEHGAPPPKKPEPAKDKNKGKDWDKGKDWEKDRPKDPKEEETPKEGDKPKEDAPKAVRATPAAPMGL
jgi:hypothetical protein